MRKFLESLPEGGRILLWFFLIAFFGGAAKGLLYRKPTTRWLDVFAQAFASGFTGFIVGTALLRWMGESHIDTVLALVGLAGWVGPTLMDYFGSIAIAVVKQKAGEAGLPGEGDSGEKKP
ncbi:MAG: phage holin family protein [Bacillota bacterium]